MIISGSIRTYKTIQSIISALKDHRGAALASVAKYWHILLTGHDFSKINKFNISPFYKQRLFSIAFPSLLENYREIQKAVEQGKAQEGDIGFISRLIVTVCSESSYELYKDYMEELLPLIVQSLGLEDGGIRGI